MSNHVSLTTRNGKMAYKADQKVHEEIYKYLVECKFSRAAKWFLRESGVVCISSLLIALFSSYRSLLLFLSSLGHSFCLGVCDLFSYYLEVVSFNVKWRQRLQQVRRMLRI